MHLWKSVGVLAQRAGISICVQLCRLVVLQRKVYKAVWFCFFFSFPVRSASKLWLAYAPERAVRNSHHHCLGENIDFSKLLLDWLVGPSLWAGELAFHSQCSAPISCCSLMVWEIPMPIDGYFFEDNTESDGTTCASESLLLQPEAFHLKGSTRIPAGLLLLLPTLTPQRSLTQLKTQKSISGMRTLMWQKTT